MVSDWIAASIAVLPKRTLAKMIGDVSTSICQSFRAPKRRGQAADVHSEEEFQALSAHCLRLTGQALRHSEQLTRPSPKPVPPLSASIRERVGEDVFASLVASYCG